MSQDHYNEPSAERRPNRGNFFVIDRWTWGKLCDQGNINEAAAYLVLAQGSIKDNRSTRWSATSVRAYAGISWDRATAAIQGLEAKCFVRTAESSTKAKPRYEILSRAEIATAELAAKQSKLTADELRTLDEFRSGSKPTRRDRDILPALQRHGFVVSVGGTWEAVPAISPTPEPIWLPNSLVTGTDAGEDSPVRRLRRAGDIWTLRLLIDLYHAQNLRDDGGINPNTLRSPYTRTCAGEQGLYVIWAFKASPLTGSWESCLKPHQHRKQEGPSVDHPLWDSVGNLQREGLLTFVPHLWDNYDPARGVIGEIIHSCSLFTGESIETELGLAARNAALAMIPDFKREKAESEGFNQFAPVKRTVPNVCMIGVGRLRYRPRTNRTGEWYATLAGEAPVWLRQYRELGENAVNFHRAKA